MRRSSFNWVWGHFPEVCVCGEWERERERGEREREKERGKEKKVEGEKSVWEKKEEIKIKLGKNLPFGIFIENLSF